MLLLGRNWYFYLVRGELSIESAAVAEQVCRRLRSMPERKYLLCISDRAKNRLELSYQVKKPSDNIVLASGLQDSK